MFPRLAKAFLFFTSLLTHIHAGVAEDVCGKIFRRQEWGAIAPRSRIYVKPVSTILIHHTQGPTCTTETTCRSIVRTMQLQHINTKGWADIGYNFIIGEDGNIYEGRGWGVQGVQSMGFSTRGHSFAIIGNFQHRAPHDRAIQAVQRLIRCGVKLGKIKEEFRVTGHRDVDPTACPGNKLYEQMRSWSRYVKRP